MELLKFATDRYKGYTEPVTVELAPLTILIGSNNSGKTALAQAIQLAAGGLAASGHDGSEPLPLESGGIHHGDSFEDLVAGRTLHGRLTLSVTLMDEGEELSLSATVRNVVSLGRPSERQVSRWELRRGGDAVVLERRGFDARPIYRVSISGQTARPRSVTWRGLAPASSDALPSWTADAIEGLRSWAHGIRHLQCPRRLAKPPYSMPERPPRKLGARGQLAPLAFAADDELRAAVRAWYRTVFGVHLEIIPMANYFELVARHPGRSARVALGQSGRGLAHALPVAIAALTARKAGPGVDMIEHPEAELHPAAHAEVAEVLLHHLAGAARPMIIETHSEMMLLRARRWIAEGRLSAEDVLVYWIQSEPSAGSSLKKIRIRDDGKVDDWPDGVFVEDYDEILAIRRAARERG